MVHAQQVEETRLRRKSMEAKKAMYYEGGSLRVGLTFKTNNGS